MLVISPMSCQTSQLVSGTWSQYPIEPSSSSSSLFSVENEKVDTTSVSTCLWFVIVSIVCHQRCCLRLVSKHPTEAVQRFIQSHRYLFCLPEARCVTGELDSRTVYAITIESKCSWAADPLIHDRRDLPTLRYGERIQPVPDHRDYGRVDQDVCD